MATEIQPTPNAEAATEVDPDRLAFEAAQRTRPIQLSAKELILGLFALILWFCLFSGGILIGTEPYRTTLQAPSNLSLLITSWLVVCAFWTITNIGLLSCVAAFLGALGRRTRFTSRTDPMQSPIDATRPDYRGIATYYVSAVMRGFGIYALVLAGLLVMATESLSSPTQAAYMRLAPTVSIVSFYAGYDPSIFAGLLDRVKSFLQTNNSESS